jgi:hypothetical protein
VGVVALIPTVVLLRRGDQGAVIAGIAAAYVALMTLVLVVYPPEQPSATRPESPDRPVPPAPGHHRYSSFAGLVLLICFLCAADMVPTGGNTLLVTGSVTLLQQDRWLGSQRALVFQLPSGQYGYLARPDDRWWLPWPEISLAPDWPGFTDATVFASYYSGLEFLGVDGDGLAFAYRDNVLHWHDPTPVLMNGSPLIAVSTSPGFMEYTWSQALNPQFLAFLPGTQGGLALYERYEGNSFPWLGPMGRGIATKLGHISAVTSVELGDGSLCVIVRAGAHLFELTHRALTYTPGQPPGDFGQRWSAPVELRTANGVPVTVSGSPQLITTGVSALGTTLLLAMPIPDGAILLSSTAGSSTWRPERLPINRPVDALTLLAGDVDDRANLDVTYRQGNHLFYIWRWDNGPWHPPSLVEWGTGP